MIDIIIDDDVDASLLPEEHHIRHAIQISSQAVGKSSNSIELCIRFANDNLVRELNTKWCNKDKVTDVLSFPMQESGEINMQEPLGDVVLASGFIMDEAKRLDVSVQAHALHLIIHGVLHLFGFDHIHDDEASVMQQHESEVMQSLNLHDPYSISDYK